MCNDPPGLSAAFALALTFTSLPAAAQEWTPRQRAACEPDAMRLCQQYVSDIGRVRASMSHYRRYLSPACRAVFEGGAKKKARRFSSLMKNLKSSAFVLRFSSSYKRSVRFGSEWSRLVATLPYSEPTRS
jgi:hypothetical protein